MSLDLLIDSLILSECRLKLKYNTGSVERFDNKDLIRALETFMTQPLDLKKEEGIIREELSKRLSKK